MNDQATATATAASKSLYRKPTQRPPLWGGGRPILENSDEHAAATLLVCALEIPGPLAT